MRTLLFIAAVLLSPALARGQAIVIEANIPGVYYVALTVSAGGQITLRRIEQVERLGDAGRPDDPDRPDGLDSDLARIAHEALDQVSDPAVHRNAQKLAVAYRALADAIGPQFKRIEGTKRPWQALANATERIREEILGRRTGAWTDWSEAVGTQLSTMEDAGELASNAAMRHAYLEIAAGLEYSPGKARLPLSDDIRQLIIRIVELILDHFFS